MKALFENSFFIRFIQSVLAVWRLSKTAAFVNRVSFFYRNSAIYGAVVKFTNREPAYVSSVAYRIFCFLVTLLNRVVNFFYYPVKRCLDASFVKRMYVQLAAGLQSYGSRLVSLFFVAFTLGLLLAAALSERVTLAGLKAPLALAAVIGLLALSNVTVYLKNSFIYKAIVYLLD